MYIYIYICTYVTCVCTIVKFICVIFYVYVYDCVCIVCRGRIIPGSWSFCVGRRKYRIRPVEQCGDQMMVTKKRDKHHSNKIFSDKHCPPFKFHWIPHAFLRPELGTACKCCRAWHRIWKFHSPARYEIRVVIEPSPKYMECILGSRVRGHGQKQCGNETANQ